MNGASLALKIGTLVLGAGIFLTMLKKVAGLKKYGLSSLLYIVVISLLLASPVLLLLSEHDNEIVPLILAQAIIIAIGTLNIFLINRLLPWFGAKIFSVQLFFMICILVFSYLFSNLGFTFLVHSKAQLVWTLAMLWFLIPFLLKHTIDRLFEVPQKEFKTWQYPEKTPEDPSDEEMENPVVISFVFQKTTNSEESTTFRAKAPSEMILGRLFFFFIDDYNSRHPESRISFSDENKVPDQWIFFRQKSKILRWNVALDPEDKIKDCKIKENDILICNRAVKIKNLNNNETTES